MNILTNKKDLKFIKIKTFKYLGSIDFNGIIAGDSVTVNLPVNGIYHGYVVDDNLLITTKKLNMINVKNLNFTYKSKIGVDTGIFSFQNKKDMLLIRNFIGQHKKIKGMLTIMYPKNYGLINTSIIKEKDKQNNIIKLPKKDVGFYLATSMDGWYYLYKTDIGFLLIGPNTQDNITMQQILKKKTKLTKFEEQFKNDYNINK